MNHATKWRASVAIALAAAVGHQAEFNTWFNQPTEATQRFFDKTGTTGKIVGLVNAPNDEYDGLALPFFKLEFDDGTVLDVQTDEISPSTEAGHELVNLVARGYACARALDYESVTHLEEDGTAEHMAQFGRGLTA